MNTNAQRVFYGNLGVTSDFYFLFNGNVPDAQIVLHVSDDETSLGLAEAESAGRFPAATVVGRFEEGSPRHDHLRAFAITRIVPHTAIRERAFAMSLKDGGSTPEQNWLHAEEQLLAASHE
jgi:hypothetical protein